MIVFFKLVERDVDTLLYIPVAEDKSVGMMIDGVFVLEPSIHKNIISKYGEILFHHIEETNEFIINVTPHELKMKTKHHDSIIIIESYDVINSRFVEKPCSFKNIKSKEFVQSTLEQIDVDCDKIKKIQEKYGDNIIIVGSKIAAEAYSADVCYLTPFPGYERSKERIMSFDKFGVVIK